MIENITAIVVGAFLIWAWIKLSGRYCALAYIVLVIFSEGLYRITSFGLGDRRIGDVAFVLLAVGIAANFRTIWRHLTQNRTSYMVAIFIFWAIVVVSIYFGSHMIFGQPFFYGLIPARKFFLIGGYFFLLGVKADRHDLQKFFKYFAWWGGVLAILGIIDSILGGGMIFQEYHQIGDVRIGYTRLAVGTFNISFSIIYATARLFYSQRGFRGTSPYLVLLLTCLFNLFFVSMTRAAIISIVLTLLFLLFRSSLRSRVFTLVGLGIIVPAVWLSMPLISNLDRIKHIEELASSISYDISRNEGNVSIRKEGAAALFGVYMERSPVVGVGLFSDDRFPDNPIAILSEGYNYHLVDVNGLATLIRFGIPGVFLLGFFLYKTFRDSNELLTIPQPEKRFIANILFALLLYILFAPTLGNIIVERMLIYTGIICYTLDHYLSRLMVK